MQVQDNHDWKDARKHWLVWARKQRRRECTFVVLAIVGMTALLTLFGLSDWMLRAMTRPAALQRQMTSNMPFGNAHLGAEYYNIAASLVAGKGFSNPFVVESGPTAWMPPLLVWLQAGLIWMFSGDRFWVMIAVVLMKSTVLAISAIAIVSRRMRSQERWIVFGVIAAYFLSEYQACFRFTHDAWFILSMVTATVFGLSRLRKLALGNALTWTRVIGWGVLGGCCAMTSPIAGFAWAVGTTWQLALRAPRQWIVVGLVSLAMILPWTIRNRVVLGKWIPVKSNVFFEFDQSMALDDDGLLDWKTMSKHPYHEGPEQEKYIAMGEVDYLATKKQRFLSQVRDQPGLYVSKVRNRLVATTLFPLGFSEFSQGSLSLPFRWLLYPVPFVSAIVLLVRSRLQWHNQYPRRKLSSLQASAIVVYFAYLMPYVLCSYYPRYGFPLLFIKILLVFWLVQLIKRRIGSSLSLS